MIINYVVILVPVNDFETYMSFLKHYIYSEYLVYLSDAPHFLQINP